MNGVPVCTGPSYEGPHPSQGLRGTRPRPTAPEGGGSRRLPPAPSGPLATPQRPLGLTSACPSAGAGPSPAGVGGSRGTGGSRAGPGQPWRVLPAGRPARAWGERAGFLLSTRRTLSPQRGSVSGAFPSGTCSGGERGRGLPGGARSPRALCPVTSTSWCSASGRTCPSGPWRKPSGSTKSRTRTR